MFGNRENISSCSSIIINTYYPFNCVFRKCFSSFFIPKEDVLDEDVENDEDEEDEEEEGKKEVTSVVD